MEETTMFKAVITAVRDWLNTQAGFERKRDTEGSLWATLDTEHYLVELLVHRAEFAPYRYVSFQVADVRLEPDQEPVYSYYDREDSAVSEVLAALDRGAAMMERRETNA